MNLSSGALLPMTPPLRSSAFPTTPLRSASQAPLSPPPTPPPTPTPMAPTTFNPLHFPSMLLPLPRPSHSSTYPPTSPPSTPTPSLSDLAARLDDLESHLHSQTTTIRHLETSISTTIHVDVHNKIEQFRDTTFLDDIHARIGAQLTTWKSSIEATIRTRKAAEKDSTRWIASALTH